MQNCYTCGKLLFGNKVLGQIGFSIYYFCSEKCRNAAWNKAGVKNADSTAVSSSGGEAGTDYRSLSREKAYKSGAPSKIIVQGAEFNYSAKTDRVTIKIQSIHNTSDEKTGTLRLEFFLSKSGLYRPGGIPSGVTLAVSSEYEPLRKNYSYTNVTSIALKKHTPKPGTYQPVLFVTELNEDGNWRTAGFANFPQPLKWNF